jgi:NADPH2:quinone reductase
MRYQFQLLAPGQDVRDAHFRCGHPARAIADGALPIDARSSAAPVFSLAETAEAHAAVEADIVGKVLIDIGRV